MRYAMQRQTSRRQYGKGAEGMVSKRYGAAGALIGVLLALPAVAAAARVPAVACQNPREPPARVPAGATVTADISAPLAAAVAFYADAPRRGAAFAPAGWVCVANLFPDVYDIEIVPELSAVVGLSETPLWRQPMVAEQVLSDNGDLPERISFDALAVSLFPALFPGGADKWVAAPLRAAGHGVGEATVKSMLPLGPRDMITRKSDRLVEFITPAGAQGLGTTGAGASFIAPADPVYGVAGLIRLPGQNATIVEIFEFRLPASMAMMRKPLMKLAEAQIARDAETAAQAQ
jgi:hypothetical protein